MKTIKSTASRLAAKALISVFALNTLVIPNMVQAQGNDVSVAGTNIISINAAADGVSAESRAQTIQHNLDNALVATGNRSPQAVKVVNVKGQSIITMGGYYVAAVDAESAKKAGVSAATLANRWADNLRHALANKVRTENYIAQLVGQAKKAAPAGPFFGQPEKTAQLSNNANRDTSGRLPQAKYPNKIAGKPASQNLSKTTSKGAGKYASHPAVAYKPFQQGYAQTNNATSGATTNYHQGKVVFIPQGMVLPISLKTAISSRIASPGDRIEAELADNVNLGDVTLPKGSILRGTVTSAQAGARKNVPGQLGVKFTSLVSADGVETPIRGHLIGGISQLGKASEDGNVSYTGETKKDKYKQMGIRAAVGAGAGTLLGAVIGAISGHHGAGRGAMAGLVIGGGLGAADGYFLRKGRDVNLASGKTMQLQLDSPVRLTSSIN